MRLKISAVFSLAMSCLAISLVLVETALARPAICSRLERQLASSGNGNGGSGNFSRYARAAAAQGQQIQIARDQARQAGCGGGFLSIFGSSQKPRSCGRIMNSISRMEANRSALLRKRDGFSGGDSSGSRRAILDSLRANNCNGSRIINVKADRKLPAAVQDASLERSSLFDQIFNDTPSRKVERTPKPRREVVKERKIIQKVSKDTERSSFYVSTGRGGRVRTLCVRTCDGFYFPVSFSTTEEHFSKDVAACTAMCPGAEAKLYYHSVPDEEPEQMVDLEGTAYMSTPNAFKYRVNGARSTPGCTCEAAQGVQSEPVIEEDALASNKKDEKVAKWIAVPQPRPDQFVDSETLANVRGALTTEKISNFLGRPDGTGETASLGAGKIRTVGPAFLPERTGAAGLTAPVASNIQ